MPKNQENVETVWENKESDGSKLGGDDSGLIVEKCKAIYEQAKGGKKKLITVSAIRNSNEDEARQYRHESIKPDPSRSSSYGFNTTDHLNGIATALSAGDPGTALGIVQCIGVFTLEQVRKNISQDKEADIESIEALIKNRCEALQALVGEFDPERDKVFDLGRDQVLYIDGQLHSITGFGEGLARDIYQSYFMSRYGNRQKGAIKSQAIQSEDLLGDLEFDESGDKLKIQNKRHQKYRRVVEDEMITKISERVEAAIAEDSVVFVGGYSPVLAYNVGFSELVAAVVAGASQESGLDTSLTVEKVRALLSADPRITEKYGVFPRVLENVNPGLALNLMHEIMANTGVIQSPGMRFALHKGVDVFVKGQTGEMTRIHDFEAQPGEVDNVSLRKTSHININIKDFPLLEPSHIQRLLDVWMNRCGLKALLRHTSAGVISLDVIGTASEEDIDTLNKVLKSKYNEQLEATVSTNEMALFCLGNNMDTAGVSKRAAAALEGIGVSITRSKQGDQQVMIFMVPKEKAELALVAVHKLCIDMTNEDYRARLQEGDTEADIVAPLVAFWHESEAQ